MERERERERERESGELVFIIQYNFCITLKIEIAYKKLQVSNFGPHLLLSSAVQEVLEPAVSEGALGTSGYRPSLSPSP